MPDRDYRRIPLDRKPSPPDPRDYRMADALARKTTAPADGKYADMTLREIATEQQKPVWKFFLSLWSLFKSLFSSPSPSPNPTPSGAVIWADSHQLDQGETGHCVGFGCSQWGNTLPFDDNFTDDQAHRLYYQVKSIELGRVINPFSPPGSGPADVEDGANVRDGMKALQANKRLATYVRATDVKTELIPWLQNEGTVVVGTDWHDGMDSPDPKTGLVRSSGSVRGGHCYAVEGYVPVGTTAPEGQAFGVDVVRIQNSWGPGWGLNGYAYLPASDLQSLLDAQGEGWAASELPV